MKKVFLLLIFAVTCFCTAMANSSVMFETIEEHPVRYSFVCDGYWTCIWKATSDYNASDFPSPSKDEFILWDKAYTGGYFTQAIGAMVEDYNRLWEWIKDHGAKKIEFKDTYNHKHVGIWFDKNKVQTLGIHNDPKQ